ncbi:MAG: hypothetical protein M1837_004307 [Sclerophora amabilis]|nr:MAG: hypothetical protein M1837_004307 [Sclerophora amabilis]
MTDLHQTLPDFSCQPYSHLLPSLDRNLITTTDLLTLDAIEVSKRAQLPVAGIRKLTRAVLSALQSDLGLGHDGPAEGGDTQSGGSRRRSHLRENGPTLASRWSIISTLDESIDIALGGGIPTGYVTEITGESGVGKTLFLMTLLLSAQLPAPRGLSKSSLYITTEHPLPTPRLNQLLRTHPGLSDLQEPPNLNNILSIYTSDLESQEHILHYQLPVAIQRHNVGLVVLDSVAANFRAEFDQVGSAAALACRSSQLIRLGALLRDVAKDNDIAVVVANQVSDRISPITKPVSGLITSSAPPSSLTSSSATTTTTGHAAATPTRNPLSLDHQQRWFTGWGSSPPALPQHPTEQNLKTPALGPTWALQLSARIALYKTPVYTRTRTRTRPPTTTTTTTTTINMAEEARDDDSTWETEIHAWKRELKVVFAPWVQGGDGTGVGFQILKEGIRGIGVAVAAEVEDEENEVDQLETGGVAGGGGGGGGEVEPAARAKQPQS